MRISEYAQKFTGGIPITLRDVILEIYEFFEAFFKMDKPGIKEEFEDVFHFLQLWLFMRFGLDGEIWGMTRYSVQKFMDRKLVWNKIYLHVGLPENISSYAGNYKKIEKVINQLQKFGISKEKAEEVYQKIVLTYLYEGLID